MTHFDFSDLSYVETPQKPSRKRWPTVTWNEERVEVLRRLWDEGYSASQIGKELGCTRNSIIGKAHRLDLSRRNHITRPDKDLPPLPRKHGPKVIRMKPFVPSPPVHESVPEGGISLIDLEPYHCRYPVGTMSTPDVPMTNGLALYCGKPRAHRAYCEYHARLCYHPHVLRTAGFC